MNTAILHYSTLPVVGGVESVIQAQAVQFAAADLSLTVITGRGDAKSLPQGVHFISVPEIDTLHPEIAAATALLNTGIVPDNFESLTDRLTKKMRPILRDFDHVIVHNVFTKHFNLPLTAALFHLMDENVLKHAIALCHDLTWSSPNSRDKVYSSYPWELLKTTHRNVTYMAISRKRQLEVCATFGLSINKVNILYNGVDANALLNLTDEGCKLIDRMELWESDLIMLMPVRITQAKNIEFAMRVVAALKTMNCSPKLIVTGPPDPHDIDSISYYRSLTKLRDELGIENEVCFVYELGIKHGGGYVIDQSVVYDFLRVADLMFMPSHREGFGIPVLEAGLIGIPIFSTAVPAAEELAQDCVFVIKEGVDPLHLAKVILTALNENKEHRLRVKVRQNYTWKAIFERDLLPLLNSR